MSSVFTASELDNPILANWSGKYGLPPFGSVKAAHFSPALRVAMTHHLFELTDIAKSSQQPTFDNTIAALDRAGGVLSRANLLFSTLCSSCSSPELQAVELEMAPELALHETKVASFPGLYARVDAVLAGVESLSPEQRRLTERIHLDFVRGGAQFTEKEQTRYSEIMQQLSTLLTTFSQNVMKDESEITMDVSEADLDGCPAFVRKSASAAAAEKGKPAGSLVITLSRSLVEPLLTFSPRRDLREKVWRLWTQRGELVAERNNLAIAKQILLLRQEQAAMHGYETFADYQLADTMAKSPLAVTALLERVWAPATASANRERGALEYWLARDLSLDTVTVEPWDWRYCAEAVRKEKYDFDETQLKPYLSLPAMQAALFDTCNKLYGIRFERVHDVVAHHPDAEVYEVRETVDGNDKLVAVFLHDNYLRSYKQSGAWMSTLCEQTRNSNMYSFEQGDGKLTITATPSSSHVIPVVSHFLCLCDDCVF
jgi:peptidyl-dipeptidase Dcp